MDPAYDTIEKHSCRMLKQAALLTRPTPANISPARPESAKTDSSPWDAPFPKQGRSSSGYPRFTFHTLRFTAPGNDARTLLTDCFSILLERPKGQHYQHADHIGKHTRIEQCRPRTVMRPVARELLLIDEFTGEDQHRQRQRQCSACSRPGIGTADDEIRREEPAEKEDQRRQDEPD